MNQAEAKERRYRFETFVFGPAIKELAASGRLSEHVADGLRDGASIVLSADDPEVRGEGLRLVNQSLLLAAIELAKK